MSVAAMKSVPSTCTVAPMRASFDFASVTLPMMSAAIVPITGTTIIIVVVRTFFTFLSIQ